MLLYEGKAKKVYSTESENEFIVYFKDDATAFNGEKKAQISSKGILNNKISTIIFEMLHEEQIKTIPSSTPYLLQNDPAVIFLTITSSGSISTFLTNISLSDIFFTK